MASVGSPEQGVFPNPVQFMSDLPPVPKVSGGLTLGRNATIGGDLNNTSATASEIPSSLVGGEVAFTLNPALETSLDLSPAAVAQRAFISWLFDNTGRLLALIIVGGVLAWLMPVWMTYPAKTLEARPWSSLGWGTLTVVLFPLAVLLFVMVIALLALLLGLVTFGKLAGSVAWLGVVLLLGLLVGVGLLAAYFTKVVVGYWGGHFLLARFKPDWAENPILSMLLGVVILVLLTAIPVIGWLLSFLITLFGLGTLWVMWWGEPTARVEPIPVLA